MRPFSISAMGTTSVVGTLFLVDENCEGAGTPSGWTTVLGTPNWDYTTVPLEGSQSLYLTTAAAAHRVRIDWTDLAQVWIYFLLRFTNGALPGSTIAFGGVSENGQVAVRQAFSLTATGRLSFFTSPTATISADTTYHVWLRVKQGTGSNAETEIGFSTDGVRPTSGTSWNVATTGTLTNAWGRLFLGSSTTTLGYDVIFDKIRVAASQIGDNGA